MLVSGGLPKSPLTNVLATAEMIGDWHLIVVKGGIEQPPAPPTYKTKGTLDSLSTSGLAPEIATATTPSA